MALSRDTRHKLEIELAEHIKKAVSSVETAPKQKHVRYCIVFAWDYQTSVPFWTSLRLQPVLSDQVQCFKALITVHKLFVGGPHIVLSESLNERQFLDNCSRLLGFSASGHGYGALIKAYVHFLLAKLDFHQTHPEFTGNFDYEEYLSLKGVDDLDEGYQTISDLQDLLDRLETFHHVIFNHFRPSHHNECRIASLVPVVEESYGMYKFVTSMLSAMHMMVESPDPLVLLVERYIQQFWSLKRFYEECSKIRYLTSLINIPKLPDQPPFFKAAVAKEQQPKPKRSTAVERRTRPPPTLEKDQESIGSSYDDLAGSSSQQQQQNQNQVEYYHETYSNVYPPPQQQPQQQQHMLAVQPAQIAYQQQQPQMMLTYGDPSQQGIQAVQPYQQPQQTTQQEVVLQQEVQKLTKTLQATVWQSTQYQEQLERLQDELAESKRDAATSASQISALQHTTDMQVQMLQDQVNQWKTKYEGMVRLYQQLRAEHLDLLSRFRDQSVQLERLSESATSAEALAAIAESKGSLAEDLQSSLRELEEARLADARALSQKDAELAYLRQKLDDVQRESRERATAEAVAKADLGSRLEEELERAARDIAAAAERFSSSNFSKDSSDLSAAQLAVHEAIRGATESVTTAIGELIRHARLVQAEIVAQGRGSGSPDAFYRQHSVWTQGLISAAQAVATATLSLIDVADGVLRGTHSLEQLVVASNGVSAAVAQLLAAARVKALPGSERQAGLESAARAVTERNRGVVDVASLGVTTTDTALDSGTVEEDPHAMKVKEMEQQVRIKRLERDLDRARHDLGQTRRLAYQLNSLDLKEGGGEPLKKPLGAEPENNK